ncbi:MAG: HNH endonuclease [Candidatus Phosphoribacter sp.]
MSLVMSLDDELALRREAMAWLALRTNDGSDAISRDELTRFTFRGERLTLIDQGRGIRKPRECRAALTIMTVFTPSGRRRPYEDVLGADGFPRYKMRAGARSSADNHAVLTAMELQVPVIWLMGVAPSWFQPVYPVYVIGAEPELDQFALAYDAAQTLPLAGSPMEEVIRHYVVRETRQRLHQPVFRSMVMRAYDTQCAVCSLGHSQLLDAAHIVEDSHEAGIAAVRNGLALCKIHHAAYDAGILGISPDLVVGIRYDILAEVDGPLFEHGIKALHGRPLMVLPRRRKDRPAAELLDWRYKRFLSA